MLGCLHFFLLFHFTFTMEGGGWGGASVTHIHTAAAALGSKFSISCKDTLSLQTGAAGNRTANTVMSRCPALLTPD